MINEKILIRQGRIRDIDALVELLRELFSIEEDFEFDASKQRNGLERMLRDVSGERFIMVAEVEGRIAGMCSAQVLISTAEGGPAAMLEDMVVVKEFRGAGIGKGLLKAIQSWAAEKGITRLQLLADKGNLPALEFYKKNDWRNTQLICLRKRVEAGGHG